MFQASFFATQVQQQRITDTVWSTGPRICKDDKALCGSLGCKLFRSSWRTITATAYEYVIYRCCTTAMEHGALDISLFAVGLPEKWRTAAAKVRLDDSLRPTGQQHPILDRHVFNWMRPNGQQGSISSLFQLPACGALGRSMKYRISVILAFALKQQ